MAMLRVRYATGGTDEWSLHEQMVLEDLCKLLHKGMASKNIVAVGIVSPSGEEVDFGFVGLRMQDVVMWEIDGFVDEERMLSWWRSKDW
jgi:hypothetical protein